MRDISADTELRLGVIEDLIELMSNQQHISNESLQSVSGLTIKRLDQLFSTGFPTLTTCCPVWTKMQMYAIHYAGHCLYQDYLNKGLDPCFVRYISQAHSRKSRKTLIYRNLFDRVLYYTAEFGMGDFKKYLSLSKNIFVADLGVKRPVKVVPKKDDLVQSLRVILAQSFLNTQGSSMLLGELLQPVFEEDLEALIERIRDGK